METKVNGSVYHKFINNYQRPILIIKKDPKKTKKEVMNKKNTLDSFHKLIYVNKKTLNYPASPIQIEASSETKSYTNNSERMPTTHQNPQKSDKNEIKSFLNEVNNTKELINGLPMSQKIKKKGNQSAHNESNKFNYKRK